MRSAPSTPRIVFRRVRAEDADLFHGLDADEDVLAFIDRRAPSVQEQRQQVDRILQEYQRWPDHGRVVAESPEGGFLGWFSLRITTDPPVRPELGYRLHRRFWGRGLATEGSRALVEHAFTHLGAQEVWAETMAVNTRSRRVLAKCGMRHVSTFHVVFDDPLPGTEHGEVRYAITRSEWLAAGSAQG